MDAASNQSEADGEAPCKQVNFLKDDKNLAPKPDYAHLLSTRGSDNSYKESWENFGIQQPEDAWDSSGRSLEHSELLYIYQTSLGLVQIPWETMPFDVDTLAKIYALPGDDDPITLNSNSTQGDWTETEG